MLESEETLTTNNAGTIQRGFTKKPPNNDVLFVSGTTVHSGHLALENLMEAIRTRSDWLLRQKFLDGNTNCMPSI